MEISTTKEKKRTVEVRDEASAAEFTKGQPEQQQSQQVKTEGSEDPKPRISNIYCSIQEDEMTDETYHKYYKVPFSE